MSVIYCNSYIIEGRNIFIILIIDMLKLPEITLYKLFPTFHLATLNFFY